MFTTPSVPTDSLYKFLFVGGIVIMIATPYFFVRNEANYNYQTNKFDSTKNILLYRNSKSLKILNGIHEEGININLPKIDTNSLNKKIDYTLFNKVDKLTKKYLSGEMSKQEKIDYSNFIRSSNAFSYLKSIIRNQKEEENLQANIIRRLNPNQIKKAQRILNSIAEKESNVEITIDSTKNEINRFIRIKENEHVTKQITDILLLLMFIFGVFMCVYGLVNWSNKIQMYQDALLELEVKTRIKELNPKVSRIGRTHFEPKLLPRQKK